MADMAEFDDLQAPAAENPPPATEEDPAAAFLAREQDELAGIEDDDFGIGSDPAQTVPDATPATQQQDDLDPLAGMGGGMGGGMDSETPADDLQTNGPSDLYSAISSADNRANEPEKIRLWREEQKEILEKKDEEADELEVEWKVSAKKEISDWYARRDEQGVKAKASNRAAEEAFIQERDEITPGQEWERIARLCDFNPKNNKNLKDITRFRSILLHLKQSGVQPSK
eukprot:XP_796327.1 PREDICTED: clathrin light chain A [Strongylocentrotus purpuratus]